MTATYAQVLDNIIELISRSAGDWEYSTPVTAQTYLLGDLGYESLDLVVLGTVIEERYGRLAFAKFLASIGQRDLHDVTVSEVADFVYQHIGQPVLPHGEAR